MKPSETATATLACGTGVVVIIIYIYFFFEKRKKKKKPPVLQPTGTPTETSLGNINSRYLKYFMIIPSRSTGLMGFNCPETGLVRKARKLKKQNEKFTVVCSRSPQTLNMVISRCYFTGIGKKKCTKFYN